jgi:hypothetical protein
MEAAAVRSWPALETVDIDGWLWRYASGGSLRANSVSALSFRGADLGVACATPSAAIGPKVPCAVSPPTAASLPRSQTIRSAAILLDAPTADR